MWCLACETINVSEYVTGSRLQLLIVLLIVGPGVLPLLGRSILTDCPARPAVGELLLKY